MQKWFLVRFAGRDTHIKVQKTQPQEFCSMKWTTLEELVNETVEFRQSIYKQLALEFGAHLRQIGAPKK